MAYHPASVWIASTAVDITVDTLIRIWARDGENGIAVFDGDALTIFRHPRHRVDINPWEFEGVQAQARYSDADLEIIRDMLMTPA